MPFPDPFLPIVLIAALVSGISMWVFNTFSSISSKIRDVHSRFALSQMVSHLGELEEAEFPKSPGELIKVLKESSIDWNSCRIDDGRILDGWGQPMISTFDDSTVTWILSSSGRDGKFWTVDDIEVAAPRTQHGEPAAAGQPATRSESK